MEYEFECPYCGNGLQDNHTPCCGEIGHGVPIIQPKEVDRTAQETVATGTAE